MQTFRYFIALVLTFTLNGYVHAECKDDGAGGSEILGTLAGAAIGGLVGSQFGGGTGNKVAIGAGVVAGGFVGNRVGNALDCKDHEYHQEATQNALEEQKTGEKSTWKNPDTGHSGEVTPKRTYTSDGQPCRDFTQTIYVDGDYEEVEGTACRDPDGTWKTVSS